MPTFLTSRTMSPELAGRVRASVRGASRGQKSSSPRRRLLVAVARVTALIVVLAVGRSFLAFRLQKSSELDHARAALQNTTRAHAASLSAPQQQVFDRAAGWLAEEAGAYKGDLVDAEMARTGMDLLARRTVAYVRGELGAFRSAPSLAEETASSRKDTLLACLLAPPPASDEKAVLARVRDIYLRGVPDAPHVDLLHAAAEGLPFLAPAWEAKIKAADDVRAVEALRRAFEHAPIEAAKRVARAELLLYAMDEPRRGSGPTEIDGEALHDVRVGVVDMNDGHVLLRLRRPVDPANIASTARVVYARGMDGCALAMSLRAAVQPAAPSGQR